MRLRLRILLSILVLISIDNVRAEVLLPIVLSTMNEQFGQNYNSEKSCWDYTLKIAEDIGEQKFCVKPHEPVIFKEQGREHLYFFTKGEAYQAFSGRFTPVVLGFFALKRERGNWVYLYATKDAYRGVNGCCEQMKLDKISNDGHYAWEFTQRSVWQDTVFAKYILIGFKDGQAVMLGEFLKNDTNDPQHEFNFQLIAHKKSGFYPIRMTKVNVKSKKEVARSEYTFSADRYVYEQKDKIARADVKKNPEFSHYQVKEYKGQHAADIQLSGNDFAHSNQNKLREGLKNGANFAGHYAVVTFEVDSGTGTQSGIIDIRTGTVYQPSWLSGVSMQSLQHNDLADTDADIQKPEINYQKDSSLMVVRGAVAGTEKSGVFFLNFQRGQFELVKAIEE